MLYIVQEEINGIWGASVLSDPKRIEWQADGTVRVREHLPDDVAAQMLFDSRLDTVDDWVHHGGDWSVGGDQTLVAPAVSDETLLLNTLWGRELALEAELWLPADGVASLIVRGNPSAMAGYRVGLDRARGVVGLYERFPAQPERVIQERPVPLSPSEWHKLKVVVQGDFFDVYVDETLLLVRHERTYTEGCFGVHAHGSVQVRNLRAYRYLGPEAVSRDWERRCQPYHLFRY
jgi:hypothetical protein